LGFIWIGTVTELGGAVTEPGGAVTEPGGAVTEPGGAVTEPGGAVTEPGGAVTEPGKLNLGTVRENEVKGVKVATDIQTRTIRIQVLNHASFFFNIE
jgi:hypothetical protein